MKLLENEADLSSNKISNKIWEEAKNKVSAEVWLRVHMQFRNYGQFQIKNDILIYIISYV